MGWNPTSMPRMDTRPPAVRESSGPLPCGPQTSPAPVGTVVAQDGAGDAGSARLGVRVETVRAERKSEFDRLLREVVRPAVERNAQDVGICIWTLAPAAANCDGSWSYVTVYDVSIGDVDDGRRRLLEREYGAETAADHERRYAECRCGEAIACSVT